MDDKIKYYPPGMPAHMVVSNEWVGDVVFRLPYDTVLYKKYKYVLVLKNRYGRTGMRDIEEFLFEIGVLKGSFTRK